LAPSDRLPSRGIDNGVLAGAGKRKLSYVRHVRQVLL
jgi:hypothetical protein